MSFNTKIIYLTATLLLLGLFGTIILYPMFFDDDRQQAGHFYTELFELCGSAFEGHISANSRSYPFIQDDQVIIAHFRICRRDRMKVALHVLSPNGQLWDRSRTLLITRSDNDIFELRHLNRQMDGRLTGYSMYGGSSSGSGRNGLQQFTAYTPNEIHDEWQIEVVPNQRFTYGSKKDGNWKFRVDFNLSEPLDELPPAPWGTEDSNQAGMQEITLEDGRTILITCRL